MAQPPQWVPWDSDTYGQHFNGRELTLFEYPKSSDGKTTYRNDYPVPPLYWSHPAPPDRGHRPTPSFPYTTSHRADFTEHRLGNGAAIRRPYPSQKFHPKLSALTTARDDFRVPKIPAKKPNKPADAHIGSNAPIGTTTMRADFREWKMPGRQERASSAGAKPTKFHGMTTTRNDFPWPKELPPPRQEPERPAHIVPAFGGSTEYRASYAPVGLPAGYNSDVGIQVSSGPYKKGGVGGQFDLFIRAGTPAPTTVSKTFTTVTDGQQTASIVVIAKRAGNPDGVIVGHFLMDGVEPKKVGVNKFEVTLKLHNEKTLTASAFYKNGKTTKSLTFKAAKREPSLRHVAQANEIPED